MATRFARVRGRGEAAERIRRGKNMVRNRDTGLRLIETSQNIYIVQRSEHYRTFKTKQIRGSLKAPHPKDCALQKEQITGKRQPDEK